MGPTSYFRSANQRARVFAWPQKISIRLKSQSVINTGNERKQRTELNISPRSNTNGNAASRRLVSDRKDNDTTSTRSSDEQKGLVVFLASGPRRRPCWWRRLKNSHGNDGRRPAKFMNNANRAHQLGNARLESSDELRSRNSPPRQVIWLVALGLL